MVQYAVTSVVRGKLDLLGPMSEQEANCVARELKASGEVNVSVLPLMPTWCDEHNHNNG